jgi:hypothetical protein
MPCAKERVTGAKEVNRLIAEALCPKMIPHRAWLKHRSRSHGAKRPAAYTLLYAKEGS